jgi:starch synthase
VPIVRETGGLNDTIIPYNEYTGEGTGFTFTNYNAHEMLEAVRRAIAVYKNREAWKGMITNGMKQDFSWTKSAQEYMELYRKLLGNE